MKKIRLTKGYCTIVDKEDYEWLSQFKWYAHQGGGGNIYAARRLGVNEDIDTPVVLMHRQIMDEPEGLEVDHIDGDGLNNRKENLRIGTHSQNMRSTHRKDPIRGVTLTKNKKNPWRARIYLNYVPIHLGYYPTQDKAIKAYNEAAEKYHKKFAHLN